MRMNLSLLSTEKQNQTNHGKPGELCLNETAKDFSEDGNDNFNTSSSDALYYTKKCWVKYNPALGKIWTNRLGYLPEGWVKHFTQQLGCFDHISLSDGLYLTQHFMCDLASHKKTVKEEGERVLAILQE